MRTKNNFKVQNMSDIDLLLLSKEGYTTMIPSWDGELVEVSYCNGLPINVKLDSSLVIPKSIDESISKLIFIKTMSDKGVESLKLIDFESKKDINFKKFCEDYFVELMDLPKLKLGKFNGILVNGILFYTEMGDVKRFVWRSSKNIFNAKITSIEWIQNNYLVFTPIIYINPIKIKDKIISVIKVSTAYKVAIRDLKIGDTINVYLNDTDSPHLEPVYPINCEDYQESFKLPKCVYCNKELVWYNSKDIHCSNVRCSSYSKLILDIIAYHHIPSRMITTMKEREQYSHQHVKLMISKLDKMTEDLLRQPKGLLLALNIPRYSLSKSDPILLEQYTSSAESINNIRKLSNMTPIQLDYFNRIIEVLRHYILDFYIKSIDKKSTLGYTKQKGVNKSERTI